MRRSMLVLHLSTCPVANLPCVIVCDFLLASSATLLLIFSGSKSSSIPRDCIRKADKLFYSSLKTAVQLVSWTLLSYVSVLANQRPVAIGNLQSQLASELWNKRSCEAAKSGKHLYVAVVTCCCLKQQAAGRPGQTLWQCPEHSHLQIPRQFETKPLEIDGNVELCSNPF